MFKYFLLVFLIIVSVSPLQLSHQYNLQVIFSIVKDYAKSLIVNGIGTNGYFFDKYSADLLASTDSSTTISPLIKDQLKTFIRGAMKQVILFGVKYLYLRYDASKNVFYLEVVLRLAQKENGGAGGCMALTRNYIIFGTWDSKNKMNNGQPQNAGTLNQRVEQIQDYLMN